MKLRVIFDKLFDWYLGPNELHLSQINAVDTDWSSPLPAIGETVYLPDILGDTYKSVGDAQYIVKWTCPADDLYPAILFLVIDRTWLKWREAVDLIELE